MPSIDFDFERDLKPYIFFSSRICHDVNNMITGALGGVTLLEFKAGKMPGVDLSTEVQRLYKAMSKFEELTKLLEKIFLRPEGQAIPFDLTKVTQLSAKKKDCERHPVQVRGASAFISIDVEGVDEMVAALIDNAKEAMPEGGPIDISIDRIDGADGASVCLKVSDRGVGIHDEQISEVLIPFKSFTKRGNLVGLGLSLVGAIVYCHNGTLHINSEPNQGTTITINFPC